MVTVRTLIHASSNDDRWFLCHGDDPADVFVFHEPNLSSGGKPRRLEISAFLAGNSGSPENQALRTMIGSLVASAHPDRTLGSSRPEPGAAGAEPSPGEDAS